MPKCQECGEYHTGRSNSKYCSNECRYKARWIERFCKQCGEQLKGTMKKQFCDSECSNAYWNKIYNDKRKVKVSKLCPVCKTKFETTGKKKYCSRECGIQRQRDKIKKLAVTVNDKYSKYQFEEILPQENDNVDVVLRYLFDVQNQWCGVKAQMINAGINPRRKKIKRKTLRGTWEYKMNVVNVEELIQLYNHKILKFRESPQITNKNSTIFIGKLIKKARRIIEENSTVSV